MSNREYLVRYRKLQPNRAIKAAKLQKIFLDIWFERSTLKANMKLDAGPHFRRNIRSRVADREVM